MSKKRRIRTHAPKIPKREEKKEESTYHRVKRHHKERAEKQAKMRGETKKQEFDSIAHLHGALGNKKVTELHQSGKLMAMLKMSKPGDRYEREADQVASQVMNTNPGTIHENSSAKVAPKVDLSKVSKKKGGTTETQIKNISGGEKLDGGTKKFFKSRFDGLDLSKVNIHKSRKANNMAESINAKAFTYGNNIVFNKGEYKPNTFQGKKLLAHELTHVAQQTGTKQRKFSRKIKLDEPGKKKVNAGNITDADRQKALENFGKRHKFKKVEQPQAKVAKKHNNIKAEKPPVVKIDKQPTTKVEKPPVIKEETVSKTVAKSSSPSVKSDIIKANQSYSAAPPVKVSSTQGKVVMGWWGKKKDEDKDKEEEDKDGKKPKGIGGFAWWAFKNLLGLIGIDVDQFTAILSKAGDALGAIIKDPKGFFGNLGKAVKGGINNFVGNFKKHLLNGIAGWLFGNLGDAGLELPSSFDFKGILSIVLQVLGLTYGNIRGQIVKSLGKGGEEMMSHGESMFEHLKTAITQGPMALWEQLKEHLSGLKDQFFGMIIDWVKTTVIKQGVMFLISMLNPAGALVQAVRAIIKVVTFFMERWQQIQDFASSVVDSVSLIAKGDVTAAQNGVENSLAKAMPITISFIAKLVGLGGISKHIKKVIKKIQKPINNAIKKVVGKFAKKIKSLPIFKKGKKALKKGKKALDKGKKKVNEVKDKANKIKEGAEKKVKDKANKMKEGVEKSRADKQKKKEDEAKDKSRKGKNKHEKKEQLKEDDKKKHKKYVGEIIQKLKADKGNSAKSFKEFHASKVKLAKDLEGRYQKKLKRGINVDITIPPLEKDKKDKDVDFKVKIAPNSVKKKDNVKYKGKGGESDVDVDLTDIKKKFTTKEGEEHTVFVVKNGNSYDLMIASTPTPISRFLNQKKVKEIEDEKVKAHVKAANKILNEAEVEIDKVLTFINKSDEERAEASENEVEKDAAALAGHLRAVLESFDEVRGDDYPKVETFAKLKTETDYHRHHVPPKALANWIAKKIDSIPDEILNNGKNNDLRKAYAGLSIEHANEGANLACILIHKNTHITKTNDAALDDFRAHYGKETSKEVAEIMKMEEKLEAITQTKKGKLTEEERARIEEAGEEERNEEGKASTQFFLKELDAARKQVEVKNQENIDEYVDSISDVFLRAHRQSRAAVSTALKNSVGKDGSPANQQSMMAKLFNLAKTTWVKAAKGVEKIFKF